MDDYGIIYIKSLKLDCHARLLWSLALIRRKCYNDLYTAVHADYGGMPNE